MLEKDNQLALCAGLTVKTQQLCRGLESGAADILELVCTGFWWLMAQARKCLHCTRASLQ